MVHEGYEMSWLTEPGFHPFHFLVIAIVVYAPISLAIVWLDDKFSKKRKPKGKKK